MATFVLIVCSLTLWHLAMAATMRPGVRVNASHLTESTSESFGNYPGNLSSRNRRQVTVATVIDWFWSLLSAGQTVFETVIVFYGFISDSIKKKKMLHLQERMQDIEEQLTDVTDDFTEARTLHLTLATLCLGAGGDGIGKRSLDSMEDRFNSAGSLLEKLGSRHPETDTERSLNVSSLIDTFLNVFQYPAVLMNLFQFVNDAGDLFSHGKEPRTVTEIKRHFDDVEDQIETLRESVEEQAFMMRQHALPKPPCQRRKDGNVAQPNEHGIKYSPYPSYESHWTRHRRSLTLDDLLQRWWSFWDYMDIFLTIFGATADAESFSGQPEETNLGDFGERLETIQRNLTELLNSIEATAAESRQYFTADPCEDEYRYIRTTTQRSHYTPTSPEQDPEESPWTNFIHRTGLQPRFFGDNPIVSAIGDKVLAIWNFIEPAFTIFALYSDVTSATDLDKKDPDTLEKIDEQLDDIGDKISDLTDGLRLVSLASLRSALDICKNAGR